MSCENIRLSCPMNKRAVLISLLAILYGGAMVVYWFNLGFTNALLRETIYLSTSCIATIAGFFALRKFGFAHPRSLTLLLLTVGMGYWWMGEMLFDYYQYIVHSNPFPSAADIFYILGYFFMLIGLVNEIRIVKINWALLEKPVLFLYGLVALLFVLLISYFGIYHAYEPTKTFFVNAIGMGYGIGDLLLILTNIFVLILVWEFRGGRFARVWVCLFLSFIFLLVADILFAMYADQYNAQVWFYKSLLDSFWMGAYVVFGYALFEFGFSIEDIYKKLRDQQKQVIS